METLHVDLDRFKKDHWSAEEIECAGLVADFVQKLMNEHDFDYVLSNYANDSYVQHNRNIADGIDGLVEVVRAFTQRFPDYCYDVKQILVDGDQVVFHSHVTMKRTDRGNDKKGFNIMDMWKIRDGKIVEHWDTIQPLDGFMRFYVLVNGGKIRNTNGVF
ncbi:MAG TPA: polyketide cyclase [Planctomycetaceae bacterium]|nr:polyketide cyclase [Planctomycetaceae bacterium]